MKTIKDLKKLIQAELAANTGLATDMHVRAFDDFSEISVWTGAVGSGRDFRIRDIADVQIAFWTIAKMGRTMIIDPAR